MTLQYLRSLVAPFLAAGLFSNIIGYPELYSRFHGFLTTHEADGSTTLDGGHRRQYVFQDFQDRFPPLLRSHGQRTTFPSVILHARIRS